MPNAGQKEHFDAFISYRRGSGYGLARSIKSALKERGIYAYLDVDDRKKILFDERFRERIAEAPSFIVVLSANSLDRCHSPEDWLRQEIACAIKAGRTIVPVKLPDFEFPPANELPEDIRKLPSYDASPYFPEMFDESIGRLVGKLRLRPRPIWKRPTFTRALIGLLAVGVIAGCVWYYERVASLRTIKQEQAFHQLEEQQQQLHQESVLMADAKAAEVQNDLGRAQSDYEKVIALHGSREVEASASLNAVRQKMGGSTEAEIAQKNYDTGVEAYRSGNYEVASTQMNQALMRSPQNWPLRAQATDYLRRSQDRMQQQQHLKQAQSYFDDKRYDAVRSEIEQVINAQDADPSMVKQAQTLLAKIPASSGAAPVSNQPSSEILALTRDAEALTGQERYKEAWNKAAAIEELQGDASAVRQTIRTAEDNKFQELSLRYLGANKQSRAELLDLQKSFQQFAGNSANWQTEANRRVAEIAGQIAALATTTIGEEDSSAISNRLNDYAEAVASGDLEKIKAVRQLKGNEERKMIESLNATKGKGYTLRNCSAPEQTADNAQVSCDTVLTGSKDTPPAHVTFFLKRIYGQWFIISSD